MRKLLSAIVIGTFLLPGCGGGSGNSGSKAVLTAHTRGLKAGDRWTYMITGTTVDLANKTVPLNGTLTLDLSMQPFLGAQALTLTSTVDLQSTGTRNPPLVIVTYIKQDPATGDVYEIGDNAGSSTGPSPEALTTPALLVPGTWSNTVALNSTLDFGTGTPQTYTLTVTGSDAVVDTPIGSYAVWTATANSGSGITEQWAPQLGAPVKITVQGGLFGSGQVTAVLQSTNVSH